MHLRFARSWPLIPQVRERGDFGLQTQGSHWEGHRVGVPVRGPWRDGSSPVIFFLMAQAGISALRAKKIAPVETMHSLKETTQWLKNGTR